MRLTPPITALIFIILARTTPLPAKSLHVPGEAASIVEAIKMADAGDTVEIAAGSYEGLVRLKSGVSLKGAGRDETILWCNALTGSVLLAENCSGGTISGITFEHRQREKIPPTSGNRQPILRFKSSKIELSDCVIQNGCGDGIHIEGSSDLKITSIKSAANFWDGIFVLGKLPRLTLEESELTENNDDGVDARGSTIIFSKNQFAGNHTTGFTLSGKEGRGELTGNQCRNNRKAGVMLMEGPSAQLRSNVCSENKEQGLLVRDDGTSATIQDNQFTQNGKNGLEISRGAHAVAENNISDENSWSGIAVCFADTSAELRINQCRKNKSNGIYISDGARADVKSNLCNENGTGKGGNGIYVRGFDTAPKLSLNECKENRFDGIKFEYGASGEVVQNSCVANGYYGIGIRDRISSPTLAKNELTGNVKGDLVRNTDKADPIYQFNEDTNYLFESGRFDRLEKAASMMRSSKARYESGEWQLKYLYSQLVLPRREGRKDYLQKQIDQIKKWIEHKPDSITARTALAQNYIDMAWAWRGSDTANHVTDEGWNGFYKYLGEAKKVIEEAEKQQEKDPQLYAEWVTLGMGLGLDRAEMDEIVRRGMEAAPNYQPLHRSMAVYLMPRWHGQRGDAEKYARQIAAQTKATDGDGLYAQIALQMLDYSGAGDYLADFKFDYDRIKQGFEDIQKTYGESAYITNNFCFMAVVHSDRPTAKTLFAKIGEDFEPEVWGDRAAYLECKRWVEGKGKAPAWLTKRRMRPP
ncbi:right-handed parallel beta-helix repeat-containing protein, partial [Candidatus Sumerlaeota bacterium]|nr:right-handed parallel beta-helix repeat-containing protein [Candidatus Sumerlaeota bacterium]